MIEQLNNISSSLTNEHNPMYDSNNPTSVQLDNNFESLMASIRKFYYTAPDDKRTAVNDRLTTVSNFIHNLNNHDPRYFVRKTERLDLILPLDVLAWFHKRTQLNKPHMFISSFYQMAGVMIMDLDVKRVSYAWECYYNEECVGQSVLYGEEIISFINNVTAYSYYDDKESVKEMYALHGDKINEVKVEAEKILKEFIMNHA